MLAVVTCSGQSLNKIVLVVPLDPSSGGVFPVRRVILNGDQTDTWLKNGPVIARIVIPTRVNHSFETWFQNARSQSPCSALPTTPPEIGIGADVASGVDICLVTALMLIMIKASPAAKVTCWVLDIVKSEWGLYVMFGSCLYLEVQSVVSSCGFTISEMKCHKRCELASSGN